MFWNLKLENVIPMIIYTNLLLILKRVLSMEVNLHCVIINTNWNSFQIVCFCLVFSPTSQKMDNLPEKKNNYIVCLNIGINIWFQIKFPIWSRKDFSYWKTIFYRCTLLINKTKIEWTYYKWKYFSTESHKWNSFVWKFHVNLIRESAHKN